MIQQQDRWKSSRNSSLGHVPTPLAMTSSNGNGYLGVHVSAGNRADGLARVDGWWWEEVERQLAVEEKEKKSKKDKERENQWDRERETVLIRGLFYLIFV